MLIKQKGWQRERKWIALWVRVERGSWMGTCFTHTKGLISPHWRLYKSRSSVPFLGMQLRPAVDRSSAVLSFDFALDFRFGWIFVDFLEVKWSRRVTGLSRCVPAGSHHLSSPLARSTAQGASRRFSSQQINTSHSITPGPVLVPVSVPDLSTRPTALWGDSWLGYRLAESQQTLFVYTPGPNAKY